MSDPPPILDYQTPAPHKASPLPYILGFITGGVLTFVAAAAAILLALIGGEGKNATISALAFAPPALLVLLAVTLAVVRRTRRFGLGMVIGAPTTLLVGFILCGGLR